MIVGSSRVGNDLSKGTDGEEGKKGGQAREKGDVVYLDGIERIGCKQRWLKMN
jgi:hypothetical protein